MISTSVNPETVLMNVTVTDTSAARSLLVGTSIADGLDATIGELENRANRNAIQLRCISGPTLNPDPVSPREKLNLALGLLLGLGVGIAQALLRYQLDTSFRTRDQLVSAGVPYLGTVYATRPEEALGPRPRSCADRCCPRPFRQLRTNLRFVPTDTPVKVLAVTSSVDGEGRSITAVELASSFAELGRRVLLVDADLRQPRLGQLLGLTGLRGSSRGADRRGEAGGRGPDLGSARPAGAPGRAGATEPERAVGQPGDDRAAGRRPGRAMTWWCSTPPRCCAVTDGAVAASNADGVILLVRHGVTARDDVLRSVETLRAVNAPMLGAVLSMVPGGPERATRLPAG